MHEKRRLAALAVCPQAGDCGKRGKGLGMKIGRREE
jgi:hypothetical protein